MFALQNDGLFRKDLYYRLTTHQVNLPPLRERMEDLPFLFEHFLSEACQALNKAPLEVSSEIYQVLMKYNFPGNIRELQSMIYDAVSDCHDSILKQDIFNKHISRNKSGHVVPNNNLTHKQEFQGIHYFGNFPTLKEVDDFFIHEAMKKSKGNQSLAAQLLGINQSTLSRKFKITKSI